MSQYQSTQDSGYNLSTEQLVLDWRKYISPEKRSRMPSMTDLLQTQLRAAKNFGIGKQSQLKLTVVQPHSEIFWNWRTKSNSN
jgi:hypothetical protein